jgi:hypothetical protein
MEDGDRQNGHRLAGDRFLCSHSLEKSVTDKTATD